MLSRDGLRLMTPIPDSPDDPFFSPLVKVIIPIFIFSHVSYAGRRCHTRFSQKAVH